MKKNLLGLFVLLISFCLQAQMTPGSVVTTSNGTIYFLSYTPPNYRSTGTPHPLIISLAGVGEQGDGSSNPDGLSNLYVGGIPKKIKDGATNMMFTYNGLTDGFVVIAPQLPKGSNWSNYYVDSMFSYAINHFNIDLNRIFLTGYSLGGTGAWNYAFSSTNINKFAGIIPISSNTSVGSPAYCSFAQSKVALWAFQGEKDALFGGNTAHGYVNNINACSNLIVPAMDTIYADEVHGADFWDNKVYDPGNTYHYPNIFQWMLKVNRGLNPATNQAPAPVATISGTNNLTLLAPVKFKDFPLLDGSSSTDADDIIVDYLWEQTAGPQTVFFGTNPQINKIPTKQWPTTKISDPENQSPFRIGLLQGVFQFRLRVKDYLTSKPNHTQYTMVTVNVNYPDGLHSAPAVNAGNSRTITDTHDRQIGDQMYYLCTDCEQKSVLWTIVSYPAGASPVLKDYGSGSSNYPIGESAVWFGNLTVPGEYKFQYSATTKNNDVGTDILTITKLGALPVNYAYINGKNAGDKNVITWATTAEVNSERFDIMRSTDGVNFTVAGSVPSKGGAVLTEYSFDDNNTPFGITYYRLSQVDKNGNTELSKTIAINNKKTGVYIEKYPNPVHDNLTVTVEGSTNGSLQVVVADMQGKTIMQQQWQKDQSQLKKTLNVAALQNGVYQMIITIGQEKKVSSFVKY